ncbi:hypothetical protein [Hymenobacter glacialis]|uniref:Uncharacterized protein n=1 Tax=Hymenobacter glacialis TaxID=1908236 RepID=A0A1G1SUL5_9BACT|nr:hypothetical protein [Hymenobacter glacialis]OGX82313.1 hypothetical protein BEN48_05020 [Hymenobacter glacialis]
MKTIFLLLFLVLHLPAWSSQIVVGLRSEQLVSWSVWEKQGSTLKHYLLLYNKGLQEMDVKIKLRRFSSHGTGFNDVATNKTFFHLKLAAQQLVRLEYPKKLLESDFTEYFENGQSIGLLPASTNKPGKTVLSDQYRFYTSEGMNAMPMDYWMAFESICARPTSVALTAAHTFYPPSETLKEAYHLAKIYPVWADQHPQAGRLDSLVTAGADASIVRLDAAHSHAVLPVSAEPAPPGFSVLAIYIERVEDGYYYNEARQRVPHKTVGGSLALIPSFPSGPSRK